MKLIEVLMVMLPATFSTSSQKLEFPRKYLADHLRQRMTPTLASRLTLLHSFRFLKGDSTLPRWHSWLDHLTLARDHGGYTPTYYSRVNQL